EVYHTLKKLLKSRGLSTAIGDEGGFAPSLQNESEAIELILQSVEQAGYKPGADFMISLDAAASEWKGENIGEYNMPKKCEKKTSEELISSWSKLRDNYPIFSIEDPLDENDWDGWAMMTEKLDNRIVLVGDDLFVTNHERLKKGIALHCGNAILIKPNQIGTLTETARAVFIAKHHGYRTIMSHRSGETEDTTIADLAVGLSTGLIKTGAPCRTDRTAKYNRLLRIEEQLGSTAEYGIR
ncbi:MAG: phosphopyruvate hydratase, partial [Acutalibacteraceae bacterium]